ncbi:MAG: hypothetical protein ACTSO3_01105 [Candidatus Heimdallarchaeaceae archaeon]
MARVTEDEVKVVVDWDGSTDLTAFIAAANILVTAVCTDSGYTDTELKEIERWLSGHFYVMKDQTPSEMKAGNASDKYQYDIGKMLYHSKQGQVAMSIDYDGNLAELSHKMEEGQIDITVEWMGEDYETEYSN